MGSNALGGVVPEVPRWTGPSPAPVATLVILYLSLACTIGTVSFAMVAKWMLNILAMRGAPGEDDKPNQLGRCKFTGRLHLLILTLPTALQLSLLLFNGAIIVYVWRINLLLALLVFFLILVLCAIHAFIYPIEGVKWWTHTRWLAKDHMKNMGRGE